MKNKIIILIISFSVFILGIVLINSAAQHGMIGDILNAADEDENEFFSHDQLIEKYPDGIATKIVENLMTNRSQQFVLTNKTEPAIDGSIIFSFNIADIAQDFFYKAGQEKRPIYHQLENGSVILGTQYFYDHPAKKLSNLTEYQGPGPYAYDYSIYHNQIALIEKSSDDSRLLVNIRNIDDNTFDQLDSFPCIINTEAIYLDWDKNGILYYDYFVGEIPVIKMYNSERQEYELFLKNASRPQISPDGTLMVYEQLNPEDDKDSLLVLYDLINKTKITTLEGSRRIFWSEDYLIVNHTDSDSLNIYDLKSGGKFMDTISFTKIPYEIKSAGKELLIKSFHYEGPDSKAVIIVNQMVEESYSLK